MTPVFFEMTLLNEQILNKDKKLSAKKEQGNNIHAYCCLSSPSVSKDQLAIHLISK